MKILSLGDSALTIEFGDRVDAALQARVRALDLALTAAADCGRIDGIIESVPTFRSLTVVFDPLGTTAETVAAKLSDLADESASVSASPGRAWYLPACYEAELAPDLHDVAARADISSADLIRLHTETTYVVYMLGFLPGFPFMGDLPEALRLPRRKEPRLRVPSGSVAIATGLTAIYPWESPGGWHLIGRCPVPLFDPRQRQPALLLPGDRVKFFPVDSNEYDRLLKAARRGDLTPSQWCQAGSVPEQAT